jgi:hypothetical protein
MKPNDVNIEEVLKLNWKIKKSEFTDHYTKTHYFLLPLLSIKNKSNSEQFKKHYVNSFIDDEEKNCNLEHCISIVFKGTLINDDCSSGNSVSWDYLRNQLVTNEDYKYHYYAGNDGTYNLIVFVFKITEKYIPDYDLILDGLYSKTSFDYRNRVMSYFTNDYRENNPGKTDTPKTVIILRAIFKKEEWLRKEVENKFNLNETLKKSYNVAIQKSKEIWDSFRQFREIFRTSR